MGNRGRLIGSDEEGEGEGETGHPILVGDEMFHGSTWLELCCAQVGILSEDSFNSLLTYK
ncbi:MAG: hypothetical protein NTAFB01_17940 [Nitrospira sp.]